MCTCVYLLLRNRKIWNSAVIFRVNFSLKLLKFWLYGCELILVLKKVELLLEHYFVLPVKPFLLKPFESGIAFCWLLLACSTIFRLLLLLFPRPYILSMSLREYIVFILFDYVFCLLRLSYDY